MAQDLQAASHAESRGAGRSRDLPTALALFLVALAVRLVYLWQSAPGPTFDLPVVDSETYDRLARALAAGQELTHEFFWQPCFYPAFLSLVYRLSDSSILAAKLVQVLLGSATCALTYRLGCVVFDRRAGLIAGGITALYGPLVFFDGELLATSWAGFWSVSLILLCLRVRQSSRPRGWLLLGAAGAIAVLTRPTFLPFLAAVAAGLAVGAARDPVRRWTLAAGLSMLLLALTVVWTPAMLMTRAHTGRWSILPASGGINLHIGNNPDSERTITIRPGSDWTALTQLPRRYGVDQRKDTGRFFLGRVRDYVRRSPEDFLRGLVAKSGQLLSSRELTRNVDLYVLRDEAALLRALVWKVGGFGFPFGLLLPLAAVGLVLCWRRLPGPLIAYLALYSLAIVLVFVAARYRTPIVPALAVVAGGGACALMRAVGERRWRPVLTGLATAVVALLLSTVPGPFPQERPNYRAELHYFLGTRALNEGDPQAAINHLRRATSMEPDHSDAHNQLGLTYTQLNNLDMATDHFQRSVRANPRSVTARVNLARIKAVRGDLDAAERDFRLALAEDPFDLDVRYHFGTVLLNLGKVDEAGEHLLRAVAGRPADPDIRNALGHALRGQGRAEEALREFETALRLDGLHRDALDALVATLIDLGRPRQAAAADRAALARANAAGDRALARHIRTRLPAPAE